jgi:hypothetical protein
MNTEELKEAAERSVEVLAAAEEHHKACKAQRDAAVRAYNEARLFDMGIELGKTIVVAPDRFSLRTGTTMRVVIRRGSPQRIDWVSAYPVTSKNQIWQRRRPVAFHIDRIIEITDKELVSE